SEADAAVGGLRFIPLDDSPPALAAMQKVFRTSYLGKVEPAANLSGVKAPLVTMHYDYTVFTSADVPADKVKTVTRLLAEQQEALGQSQPLFRQMDVAPMYTRIDVQFHDGAIAYFGEKGIKETH